MITLTESLLTLLVLYITPGRGSDADETYESSSLMTEMSSALLDRLAVWGGGGAASSASFS